MRDVIREIAESDPYYYLDYEEHACIHCWNWSRNRNDEDSFVHADDCLWVYCREQRKDEFMVIVSEIVPENEVWLTNGTVIRRHSLDKDLGFTCNNCGKLFGADEIYKHVHYECGRDAIKDIEEIDEERQKGLE